MIEKEEAATYLKAIRLFNVNETECSFEYGKIPTKLKIEAKHFFAQTEVGYEKLPHAAPRRQYVITLKGALKFEVTNGDTFILEPGVILFAEDTEGPGHTWEIVDGNEWERIYIPVEGDEAPEFIAD